MFATDDSTDLLLGLNWVPGMIIDQTPYRSKLSGIDGLLTMLQIITSFFQIATGTITIGLDCIPAMNQAQSTESLRPYHPSFDLLQDIDNWIKNLPLWLQWRHVESHQDNTIPYNQLDWWAQQNVDMDKRAKDYALLCHSQNQHTLLLNFFTRSGRSA